MKTLCLAGLFVSSGLSSALAGTTGDYPGYPGQKKMAIIMLNWSDRSCPATRQDIVNRMWNDSSSVRKYYRDMSRDILDFIPPAGSAADGTVPANTTAVYGPYTLSIAAGFDKDVTYANADDLYGGKLVPNVRSVARNLAAADGYDANNYDYIMYITPKADTTGTTGGYAGYGANYSHMFDIRQNYLNHELGHNLGLSHSNTQFNVDGYGSQDCVMGNKANAHLDGPHSYQMGWYPDACFPARSYGQYDIENLAQPNTDNVKVLRFDRGAHGATSYSSYNLWVEYRVKGVGQDSGLDSNWDKMVNIHYCVPRSRRPTDSSITYEHWNNNMSKFSIGGSYTEPDNICRVQFLRATSTHATVQLIDPAGNQPPAVITQNVSIAPGTTNFTIQTADPENDALTYTILAGPSVGTLTHSGSTFTYTGTTSGSYTFTVRVNDGQYDSVDKSIALIVAGVTPPTANAGDDQTKSLPSGASTSPGLWFGTASGNINTTTPNPETEILVNVGSKTEDLIAGNTTEIFTGQIYDADGQISFTEYIDDKARIWIDGVLVINNDVYSTRASTANLNLTPGWHDIEIRISNGSGGSGPVGGQIGIGYDPAGGTAWQTIVDPGDGSLLRCGTAGVTISLNGTVYDADGDALTISWTTVSGPGSVIFGNASAEDTATTFITPGQYILRLTVTDGLNTTSDEVTITVTESSSTYSDWALGTFAHPFTDTNLAADPDGDGYANLLEFAFGMDPTSGTLGSLLYEQDGDVSKSGAPVLQEAPPGSGIYHAVFGRRKDYQTAGLSYTCEFSVDLATWTASAAIPTVLTGPSSVGDIEAVKVPYPVTGEGSDPPQFFRVRVDNN